MNIKIYLNDDTGKRRVVSAELLENHKRTVTVRLSDGSVIKRKKTSQVADKDYSMAKDDNQ